MTLPERCQSCPLPWSDALFLVGVSVALVLFGRVLLALPRRLQRGFGLLGLGASLVLHAFGLATIALVGIGSEGARRLGGREAVFAAGWLALSGAAFWLGARIARAFPRRAARLRLVAQEPDGVLTDETPPPRVRHGERGTR